MDDIRYIYIQATNGIEGTIDEKQFLFGEMFYFMFCFFHQFKNSNNLFDLLSSVYSYYIDILKEVNREHDIYEELEKYLNDMDNKDIEKLSQDEEMLTDILGMLETIEQIVEGRILHHTKNYGFYKNLLDSQDLNNMFYKSIKYKPTITEEKKQKFLALISRG